MRPSYHRLMEFRFQRRSMLPLRPLLLRLQQQASSGGVPSSCSSRRFFPASVCFSTLQVGMDSGHREGPFKHFCKSPPCVCKQGLPLRLQQQRRQRSPCSSRCVELQAFDPSVPQSRTPTLPTNQQLHSCWTSSAFQPLSLTASSAWTRLQLQKPALSSKKFGVLEGKILSSLSCHLQGL